MGELHVEAITYIWYQPDTGKPYDDWIRFSFPLGMSAVEERDEAINSWLIEHGKTWDEITFITDYAETEDENYLFEEPF